MNDMPPEFKNYTLRVVKDPFYLSRPLEAKIDMTGDTAEIPFD